MHSLLTREWLRLLAFQGAEFLFQRLLFLLELCNSTFETCGLANELTLLRRYLVMKFPCGGEVRVSLLHIGICSVPAAFPFSYFFASLVQLPLFLLNGSLDSLQIRYSLLKVRFFALQRLN